MSKLKTYIAIGLYLLMFAGCVSDSTDSETTRLNEDSTSQSTPYEAFIQKIQSENFSEYGIDIVTILNEDLHSNKFPSNLPTLPFADVTRMDYTTERCNLTQTETTRCDDLIIRIDAVIEFGKKFYEKSIILAFVLNTNGQMTSVIIEENQSVEYEVKDVTGDGIEEIILIASNGGQGLAEKMIQILSWRGDQSSMTIIFDETLYSRQQDFVPYSCQGSYQMQPAQNGGYDIILDSWIARDKIFESGSSRFIFNGEKYIVNGVYYDYMARVQSIRDWADKYAPESNV